MKARSPRFAIAAFLVASGVGLRSQAQEHGEHASGTPIAPSSTEVDQPHAAPPAPPKQEPPKPAATSGSPDRSGWPKPIDDSAPNWFVLIDQLEYQRLSSVNAIRWDINAWYGGDTNRIWLKSSADLYLTSPLGGEVDVQLLYGRMISPFFDVQVGARLEQHFERTGTPRRAFLAVGVQGLAPGNIEVEPTLFLSNKGNVSARFTASIDFLLTQRLVLQPRFETELAVQRDEEFGVDPGVNDLEGGLRLRYEIWRELAPYVGVAYRASLGATRDRVAREGGVPNTFLFAAGVRVWF